MKIDDAIIDKVLNNKASAEDAKAVSEWLATEEGHDYLSKRIDREVSSLTENEVEDWVPHVIPEEKMQQRFLVGGSSADSFYLSLWLCLVSGRQGWSFF